MYKVLPPPQGGEGINFDFTYRLVKMSDNHKEKRDGEDLMELNTRLDSIEPYFLSGSADLIWTEGDPPIQGSRRSDIFII